VSGGSGPRVGPLLETCLYAMDLETTARFYEDVLGLRSFTRVEGRHVFFGAGSGVFLLFNPTATAAEGGRVPPHGAMGAGHVAFAVPEEEIGRWNDWLAEVGVAVEQEVAWPGGGVSLYLRDPAGNSVELATPSTWSIPEATVFGAGPSVGES
jgi:catechol 2,3-dioxygenase-like lactoylglutathione lyase family enzyme